MTKEGLRKEVKVESCVVPELTAREEYAICWTARRAYDDIWDYLIEDYNTQLMQNYMSIICLLHKENPEHALYMISTLLEQAFACSTLNLTMELCQPNDGSIDIYVNELLATAYEALTADEEYDEDDEEDADWYDIEWDDCLEDSDERPFAVIKICGNDEEIPGFKDALKHVLKVIGITPNDLKKRESEEDE